MDIKSCPECKVNILTTEQRDKNQLCADCQQRHAKTLRERLEIENTKQEFR